MAPRAKQLVTMSDAPRVRVPTPSWGTMLQDAKPFVRQVWTLVFIPGFAMYITVLSINLVGTGLREALDPRLNQSRAMERTWAA